MIDDRDLVMLQRKGSPFTQTPVPRDKGEASLARLAANGADMDRWEMIPVASCRCCGEPAWVNLRCTKHQDRNPCVVEGCKRTRKANGYLSSHAFICGEHWKAYVPPGSPERRVINRFFRQAKKLGYGRNERWPEALERRYWRFWEGLLRRVRSRSTEGFLDQREIERLFGWTDEG